MAQNTLERLLHLSDIIEQEERILQSDLRAGQTAPNYTEADNTRKKSEVWSARLLLRVLRIHLCLDMMDAESAQCHHQILRDWADAAEFVRKLSDAPDITRQVLADTLDLVLLLRPNKRKALINQLHPKTRMEIRRTSPLSFPVKIIALDMGHYCQKTGRTKILCSIVRNLILLGEKRNAGYPEQQREVVADCLICFGTVNWSLTAKLCKSQQQYFEDTVDQDSCIFYWFYGFSAREVGDFEHAADLLKHSYDLCMVVEGETSWNGARAGSTYYCTMLGTDQSEAAEAYLRDVLHNIDTGFYQNMAEDAAFIAAYIRVMLLDLYCKQGTLRNYPDDILAFQNYCISVQDTTVHPYLTVRQAENLLSAYHLEAGEPLLAAAHSQQALSSIPPNNLPKIPSDIMLYTNLLSIYGQLHDEAQVDFYIRKVLELSEEWEKDPYLNNRINTLLLSYISDNERVMSRGERLSYNDKILSRVYRDICCGTVFAKDSIEVNTAYAMNVLVNCGSYINSPGASMRMLFMIRGILDYFLNRPERYLFSNEQRLYYTVLQARNEELVGSPMVVHYLNQAWQQMGMITPGVDVRISSLRYIAIVYHLYGERERSLEAANLFLSDTTAAWQKATAYFNDRRVCQALSTLHRDFRAIYTVMRPICSSAELYECILRFKDLPALVGRERNTLLRQNTVDEECIRRLRSLQDRLASAELNDSLRGTDTARAVREELENAEADLSSQFTEKVRFTEITFESVCRKLPENSAIVEYFFVLKEDILSWEYRKLTPEQRNMDDVMELETFITVKVHGQTRLHHLRCRQGSLLMDEALELSYIFQNPDDLSASGQKAALRASLYQKLIAPVLPFLEGVTRLYIAPDNVLCNVPFEILYGEDRILLQDRYRICRVVCGRDLLFYDDQCPSGGSFILGNPNYEAERGQRTQSKTRSGQGSLEPVEALPFSGVEARRIGRRCRSSPYTGDSATKYALRDAQPCRIIHLATHGVYDESLEKDSLYSSHLVFAGYNKWSRNQTESNHCGNGILTADEISRMDLKKTELVVLSACRTGMGNTNYGSVRGLLSAFSAAGARWVISHLWEASDFTTPILMDAFYEAFLKKGMDVPEALQYAKNYLKTITIGQLKRDCWLELPRDILFPEEVRQDVEEMSHWPDGEMPFQDEYYWGGFTVHKSR